MVLPPFCCSRCLRPAQATIVNVTVTGQVHFNKPRIRRWIRRSRRRCRDLFNVNSDEFVDGPLGDSRATYRSAIVHAELRLPGADQSAGSIPDGTTAYFTLVDNTVAMDFLL
jgi:hypothetical protein